eukprot:185875-Amorphochlora_amoeboformis.AAC.2
MATATASAGPGPPACATPSHQPKKDRKSLVWDFAIDRVGIRPFERKREKEILRKLEEDEPDHESKLYVTPIKSDVEGAYNHPIHVVSSRGNHSKVSSSLHSVPNPPPGVQLDGFSNFEV